MAGHSKWANIKHRKGRQDAKRGKLWSKIARQIIVNSIFDNTVTEPSGQAAQTFFNL